MGPWTPLATNYAHVWPGGQAARRPGGQAASGHHPDPTQLPTLSGRRPYVELLECGLTKNFSIVDTDDSESLVKKVGYVWSGMFKGGNRKVQQMGATCAEPDLTLPCQEGKPDTRHETERM